MIEFPIMVLLLTCFLTGLFIILKDRRKDIFDLNPHRLKEIEHFFQVYKDLEKKKVDVGGWGDRTEAENIYKACVERYQNSEEKKSGKFKI